MSDDRAAVFAEQIRALRDLTPATGRQIRELWEAHIDQTTATTAALQRMETRMAADRDLLALVAEGLTRLSVPISELIESERAARARVAELEGQAAADELGDVEAAQGVKDAFDVVAARFTAEPDVPDVEPLPDPEPDPEPVV